MDTSLDPLFDEYVNYLDKVKRRDYKTVARVRCALARLSAYLDMQALEADGETLEGYFHSLRDSLAESTLKTEVAAVRAAYRYAVKKGKLEAVPAFEFECSNGYDAEPFTFSNQELRRIRDQVTDGLDDAIVHLLAYTGMRRAEMVNLKWTDVSFDDREIKVVGKGKKLRRIPIHPVLLELLQKRRAKYPHAVPVLGLGGSLRNVNWRLGRLLKRAGVNGGNRPAHAFRKTVASSLIEEGARPNDVDKIMGWAAPDVKARYYVRTNPALQDVILKLYASDPLEVRPGLKVVA
jgi:integrase/recombinase XerC